VLVAEETYRQQAMEVVQELRMRKHLAVEYAFQGLKIAKQFHYAEERGFDFVIIVDSKINQAELELKDLRNRHQQTVQREHAWITMIRISSARYRVPGWTGYSALEQIVGFVPEKETPEQSEPPDSRSNDPSS
jgi:hypothetical protein